MKICNTLDEVQRIETKVGQSTAGNLAYSDPADEMQARFSMQYCLATALLQGRLSLADFTRYGNICPANVPDQGITAAIKSKLNQIPIQTADTAMVPILSRRYALRVSAEELLPANARPRSCF